MPRKKTALTAKTKQLIQENWHKLPFDQFGGDALKYLKYKRTLSLNRIAKAKKQAAIRQAAEKRRAAYYTKNPVRIDGEIVRYGSAEWNYLETRSEASGKSIRAIAKSIPKEMANMRHNLEGELNHAVEAAKGRVIYINESKTRYAILRNDASIIYHTASILGGFGVYVTRYERNRKGHYFFTMPDMDEVVDVDTADDLDSLLRDYNMMLMRS